MENSHPCVFGTQYTGILSNQEHIFLCKYHKVDCWCVYDFNPCIQPSQLDSKPTWLTQSASNKLVRTETGQYTFQQMISSVAITSLDVFHHVICKPVYMTRSSATNNENCLMLLTSYIANLETEISGIHTIFTWISATAFIKFFTLQMRHLLEGGAYLRAAFT